MPERPTRTPSDPPLGSTAPPDPTLTPDADEPSPPTAVAPDRPPPGSEAPTPSSGGGRYELLGELARGGMGVVYRATDTVLGREVAVKVLQHRFGVGSGPAVRFLDEARVTGQLQHPGVPAVHDLGTLPDGRPFLAMKLVKGQTLDRMLRNRPDPATDRGRFLAAFEQICQAVAFAHSKGVIHRDLKPANVMVGSFGEVQVMDWGLAKVLTSGRVEPRGPVDSSADPGGPEIRTLRDTDGSATRTGSVLGTPAYMPPEQAGGEAGKADRRSDVFGLGAVLCVILTGKPPYVGEDAEDVRQMAIRGQLGDCLARLRGCGAEPELVELCERCLSADPAGRPADAGEVAAVVGGLRAAAEDRARRAEVDRANAVVRAAELRKRRRAVAAAAVAVGGLVLFGLWWQGREAADRRREREVAAARDRAALEADLGRLEVVLRADRLTEADGVMEEATRRVGDATPADLRERYERLREDHGFATRSLRLHEQFLRAGQGDFIPYLSEARFADLFRLQGITRDQPSAAVAAAVRGSAAKERLVSYLERWMLATGDRDTAAWLYEVIAAADTHPARAAAWGHAVRGDRAGYVAACRGINWADVPASFAAAVGRYGPPLPADLAEEVLRTAYAVTPSNHLLLLGLGERASAAGRHDDAVAYSRAVVALVPNSAAGWNNLGAEFHHLRKYREVLDALTVARKLAPVNGAIAYNLGIVNRDAGNAAEAETMFRHATKLEPDDPRPWHDLALVLIDSGRGAQAAPLLDKALEVDPAFGPARAQRAHRLWDQKRYPEALAEYRRAAADTPSEARVHRALGLAEGRLGNRAEAIAALRAAAALAPTDADVFRELGRELRDARDYPAAEAAYRRSADLAPTHAKTFGALGHVRLAQGKLAEAEAAFRRAVELDPELGLAHLELAKVLLRDDRPHEAYARLVRVMASHPAWATNPTLELRWVSAAAAARIGAGGDLGGPSARHRAEALGWLRADLEAWKKRGATNPATQADVAARHWLASPDLEAVRDPTALTRLPAAERAAWEAFWADVRLLLGQGAPLPVAPAPRPRT